MDINGVSLGMEINNEVAKTIASNNNEFKVLIDMLTGGKMAEEICSNYNITLDIGSICNYQELIDTYDIRCTNYVRVSPETLSNMENNPLLKKTVLSAIEEFCSAEEQAKIKALLPPVKSAGMLIYPDGSILYWLEGYPNEFGSEKTKKMITSASTIDDVLKSHIKTDDSMSEEYLEMAMQILATSHRKDRR